MLHDFFYKQLLSATPDSDLIQNNNNLKYQKKSKEKWKF